MPNIVFASNNLVHWPLSESSTTAGTYDSTRVPYSFFLNYNQGMSSVEFAPVSGNVTWVHFRLYFADAQDGNFNDYEYPLIRVFDTSDNELFKTIKKNLFDPDWRTKMYIFHDGGSITGDQAIPFNKAKMNTVDLRYENTGSLVNLKLYVNGALAKDLEYTGAATFGKPAKMTIGAAFSTDGAATQHVSEFLVADGDTRNARLEMLRPTAVGGESDWPGEATDLADNDPATGMQTTLTEQRETVLVSAYAGAANVSAVVVASLAYAGVGGPQNMRHTVRMSTVNYDDAADTLLSETLKYVISDIAINPGTSLPWTSADLSAIEMGFISKT